MRSKISEKFQGLNKGRALYTAFMLPTTMTFMPMSAHAANDTIWTKASEIICILYNQHYCSTNDINGEGGVNGS